MACRYEGPVVSAVSENALRSLGVDVDSVDLRKYLLGEYGSIENLKVKAELGLDNKAQVDLATVYEFGIPELNIDEDFQRAFMWYRRAAGEDYDVDFERFKGQRLIVDLKFKALKKLHKFYLCGKCPEGQPQPTKAFYYLKKAAELGDPEAQKDLGLSYLIGEAGKPKDLNNAKRWLQKAAKNGNDLAQETLKELDKKNVLVPFEDSEDDDDFLKNPESTIKQVVDIEEMQLKDEELHSFVIKNPEMFNENTFKQYPDSPTAQRYLKAYRLVSEGFQKLIRRNGISDPEVITLLARGVLHENSIIQPFGSMMDLYRDSLKTLIVNEQRKNPHFFEGSVFLILKIMPMIAKKSRESSKLDFRKIMALNNLIKLIKKFEPNKPPKVDPYSYENDYSSWLHVLYYFLGSFYTASECFRDGAAAFQKALECCPNYFEAKPGLAYCLMQMGAADLESNLDEELLESFELPASQRIPKGDFSAWTKEQKLEKAEKLFLEYLEDAPECDKKYTNCLYHLAFLYSLKGDIHECIKWKEKGEDSEEKRLPFMGPVDVGSKKFLAFLDLLPINKMLKNKKMLKKKKMLENKKKCNNKKCKKEGDDVRLRCPCHKVDYCSSECQKADWKEHKKTCPCKKQKSKREKDKQNSR